MAIHRVSTDDAENQDRKPLRHVLVTIDDLKLLMDLMASYKPGSLNVRVLFDGGYFTEAADIRSLTPAEGRTLRPTAAGIQVILSDREAVAVGEHAAVAKVWEDWAKRRQTKRYPSAVTMINAVIVSFACLMLIVFGLAGLYVLYAGIFHPQGLVKPVSSDTLVAAGAIGVIAFLVSAGVWLDHRHKLNYAVIVRQTLPDYLDKRPSLLDSRVGLAINFFILLATIATVVVAAVSAK